MKTTRQQGSAATNTVIGIAVAAGVIGVATWSYLHNKEQSGSTLNNNDKTPIIEEDQQDNPVAVAAALYNSVLSDDFSNVDILTARLKAIKIAELEEAMHVKKQKTEKLDEYDLQELNNIEAELIKLNKKNESEILEIDITPYLSQAAIDNIKNKLKTVAEQIASKPTPENYKYYLDVAQNVFTFYKPTAPDEIELMRSIKAYRAFSKNAYYTIEDIRSLYGPVDALKVCRYLIGSDDYSRISSYEMQKFITREINILLKKIPVASTENREFYTNDDFTELNSSTLQDLVNLNHTLPAVITFPALVKTDVDINLDNSRIEYEKIISVYDKSVRSAANFASIAEKFYECQISTASEFKVKGRVAQKVTADNLISDKIPLTIHKIVLTEPIPGCDTDVIFVASPNINEYRNTIKTAMTKMSDADIELYSRDIKLLEKLNSGSNEVLELNLLSSDLAAVESKIKFYAERGFYHGTNMIGKLANLNLPSYTLLHTLGIRGNADLIFNPSPILAAKKRQAQEKLKIVNSFRAIEESMILLDFDSLLQSPYEYLLTREKSTFKQLESLSSSSPEIQSIVNTAPTDDIGENFAYEENSTENLIAIASNEDFIELDSTNIDTNETDNSEEIAKLEEAKAQKEAEDLARAEAENKAKEEAKKQAELKAQQEAEAIAKAEAEKKEREEAEKQALAEADKRAEEAEALARLEEEKNAQTEAAVIARADAEKKAKEEAEALAKNEADALAAAEAARKAEEEAAALAEKESEVKLLTKEELVKADIKTIKQQIEHNNAAAMFELASRYISGKKGVRRNIKEGNNLLTKAAEADYPEAKYMLGSIYLQGKYSKQQKIDGAKYIIDVAENGMQDAMYLAGSLYLDGTYVPANMEKAAQFLSLAAEKNNTDAQYKLGMMYLNGTGVKEDHRKAVTFLTSASKKNGKAAYELANIYDTKQVKDANIDEQTIKDLYVFAARKNIKEAYRKAGIALISNMSTSKEALKYLADYMNKNDKEVNEALMNYYLKTNNTAEISKMILSAPKEIQEQYPVEMGLLYASGNGVKRDFKKALEFYTIGMNRNIPDAFCHAGDLYSTDSSGMRNLDKASQLYDMGIRAGSSKCIESYVRTNLASNKPRNFKEIFAILNRVSPDKLSDGSKVILASMYYYGVGIEKNEAHARRILANISSPKAKTVKSILLHEQTQTCGHPVLMGETGKSTRNTTLLSAAALVNLFYYADVRSLGVVNFNDVYSKAKRICGANPNIYILHDANNRLKKPSNNNPTDAVAQYNLAMNYFYEGKYDEAFEWMNKSAEQKYFKANNNVGIFYLMGIGTQTNDSQAYRNLNYADSAGDYKATFNLAALQMNGIGGPGNKMKAFSNMKSAALKGNEMAAPYISAMYARGMGDNNNEDAIRILSNLLY